MSGTNSDVFLIVVNAAGTATEFGAASPLAVAGTNRNELQPIIAASGEHAVIVYAEGGPPRSVSAPVCTYVCLTAKRTRWDPGLRQSARIWRDHLFNPG